MDIKCRFKGNMLPLKIKPYSWNMSFMRDYNKLCGKWELIIIMGDLYEKPGMTMKVTTSSDVTLCGLIQLPACMDWSSYHVHNHWNLSLKSHPLSYV